MASAWRSRAWRAAVALSFAGDAEADARDATGDVGGDTARRALVLLPPPLGIWEVDCEGL